LDEQYVSFEEALQELGIGEGELRAMITRGQLRVFGRPGEEKFRRSAIQNLKKAGETQPTIILPDAGEDSAEEPLPFISDEEPMPPAEDDTQEEQPLAFAQDDTQQELPPFSEQDDATDAIMPTVELSAEDAGEQSFDEEHTDVATQEVSLADDDYLILEDDREAAPTGGRPRRGYSPAGADDEFEEQPQPAAYIEEETPQPVQTVLLGLLSIVLLISAVVFVGAATGNLSAGLVETLQNLGDKLGLI